MPQLAKILVPFLLSMIGFLFGQWYHHIEEFAVRTDGRVSGLEARQLVMENKALTFSATDMAYGETMKEVVRQLQILNSQMAVMIDHDKRHFGEK